MQRRLFLTRCLAAAAGACMPVSAAAQFPSGGEKMQAEQRRRGSIRGYGCYLSAAEGRDLSARPGVVRSSGIPYLDQVMPHEAGLLSQFYGVSPGFLFIQEEGSSNAFASPESVLPGTHGTVMFGVRLIHEEKLASVYGDSALVAIMAHEWGHVLQFAHRVRQPGKAMELSADFMAGWWLGFKAWRNQAAIDVGAVAQSLFQKGDYEFNSPDHHGTPRERVQAMQAGFTAAGRGVANAAAAFQISREALGLL